MTHHCHAIGCAAPTARRLFACLPHWAALSPALRERLWAAYQPGQENGAVPVSPTYLRAVAAARLYLAEAEGHPQIETLRAYYARLDAIWARKEGA